MAFVVAVAEAAEVVVYSVDSCYLRYSDPCRPSSSVATSASALLTDSCYVTEELEEDWEARRESVSVDLWPCPYEDRADPEITFHLWVWTRVRGTQASCNKHIDLSQKIEVRISHDKMVSFKHVNLTVSDRKEENIHFLCFCC